MSPYLKAIPTNLQEMLQTLETYVDLLAFDDLNLENPFNPVYSKIQNCMASFGIYDSPSTLKQHKVISLFYYLAIKKLHQLETPGILTFLSMSFQYHGLSNQGGDVAHMGINLPVPRTLGRYQVKISKSIADYLVSAKKSKMAVCFFDNHQIVKITKLTGTVESPKEFSVMLLGAGSIIPPNSGPLITKKHLVDARFLSLKGFDSILKDFNKKSIVDRKFQEFTFFKYNKTELLMHDPVFRSFLSVLLDPPNRWSSSNELFKIVNKEFEEFEPDITSSGIFHSRHSRISTELNGVLFPLIPSNCTPTKSSCIDLCKQNHLIFASKCDLENTKPLKAVFAMNSSLQSWSKCKRIFKILIEKRIPNVIHFDQFLCQKHLGKSIPKKILREIFSSSQKVELFLKEISTVKIFFGMTVHFQGVISGVDQLIYAWLSKQECDFIFPWLGEFHLLYNFSKACFLFLKSSTIGIWLLNSLGISVDINGIIKPSIQSAPIQRNIDWLFILGSVIRLINSFYELDYVSAFRDSNEWADILVISSITYYLELFIMAFEKREFDLYVLYLKKLLLLSFRFPDKLWRYKRSIIQHLFNFSRIGSDWAKYIFNLCAYNVDSKTCGIVKGLRRPADWGNEHLIYELNSFTNSSTQIDNLKDVANKVLTFSFLRSYMLRILQKPAMYAHRKQYINCALVASASRFLSLNPVELLKSNYKCYFSSCENAQVQISCYSFALQQGIWERLHIHHKFFFSSSITLIDS